MKVMLTENQFPTLGLVNDTIGTGYEIIFDHDVSKNDSVFIKRPLHILVDFNSFINNHKSSLNDIMIEGLSKNIFLLLQYPEALIIYMRSKDLSVQKKIQ
jgi:hypothetical protein